MKRKGGVHQAPSFLKEYDRISVEQLIKTFFELSLWFKKFNCYCSDYYAIDFDQSQLSVQWQWNYQPRAENTKLYRDLLNLQRKLIDVDMAPAFATLWNMKKILPQKQN